MNYYLNNNWFILFKKILFKLLIKNETCICPKCFGRKSRFLANISNFDYANLAKIFIFIKIMGFNQRSRVLIKLVFG